MGSMGIPDERELGVQCRPSGVSAIGPDAMIAAPSIPPAAMNAPFWRDPGAGVDG